MYINSLILINFNYFRTALMTEQDTIIPFLLSKEVIMPTLKLEDLHPEPIKEGEIEIDVNVPDIIHGEVLKRACQQKASNIYWTVEEKKQFEEAYSKLGRKWKKYENIISTRTLNQIRSYGQRYIKKKRQEKKFLNFNIAPTNEENSEGEQGLSDLLFKGLEKIKVSFKKLIEQDIEIP